jgi:GAF domain-containing protein
LTGRGNEPGEPTGNDPELPQRVADTLRAIALRTEIAGHLAPPAGAAVLNSVVEATVALFGAEAASIALFDPATNRLVFRVAAGTQGQGVVGVEIPPDQGVAGYVFTTGQPLALSDVARDARFGRDAAEQTGYVPRSLVAVPLLDDEGTIGVLEVLDKRDEAGFDLRDVELASVFARQATIAIRSSRVERDTAALLRKAIADVAGDATAGVDEVVAAAVAGLDSDDDTALWGLADEIARLRTADPSSLDLVRELLAVLARRAERSGEARLKRRGR